MQRITNYIGAVDDYLSSGIGHDQLKVAFDTLIHV